MAGALGRYDRLGMILAAATLDAATEGGIGRVHIVGPTARHVADFGSANLIAATYDHWAECMLLRTICKSNFIRRRLVTN